jgi:cytochrome P450
VERRVAAWVGRRDVRVLAETRELALEVMFRLVGVAESEIGAWRHQYEQLVLLFINLPVDLPGTPRRRGMAARRWIDERLRAMILRARGEGGRGLLPALLQSRDEAGELLSDEEMVDNLRLIFLAGHETSASTMAWMVAHLSERPDVWQRLRAEALAAPDLPRSPKDLRQFPYAEAVFRETLRLHPPVSQDARRAVADFELDGRTVPKGTQVAIPILTMSRDPERYPEPDAFRPERWLDRQEALSPLELVQFGGGPHFCLGYHLAWMEIVAFATALGRALPAGGPRLQNGFPAPRYVPLHHPAASMKARFD